MCETEFCAWRKKEDVKQVFKNMFGREPTELELQRTFDFIKVYGRMPKASELKTFIESIELIKQG
jgi:hypothetical protein